MNWVKNSVLLAVSILFCIIVLEIGARFLDLGYSYSPLQGDGVLHHKHPVDYSFMGYHPKGMWDDIAVHYDRYGNRFDGKTTIETPDGVVLGDSFVEATMVPYSATIPAAFATRGRKVWNLGVSSYSPILSYLQLKGSKDRLSKANFVLHLLYINDVEADLEFEKIAIISNDEVTGVPWGTDWVSDILRNVHLFRAIRRVQLSLTYRLGLTDDNARLNATEAMPINGTNKKYLSKTHELTESLDARYFLSCVPPKEHGAYAAREEGVFCQSVREFAHDSGIDYIDLPRKFSGQKLFIPQNIHFTAAASARISDYAADKVIQTLASD
jgi:hypothetical protein